MLTAAHSWQGLPSSSPNTTTLGFFDQRVMLAWILTTPVALMAGQLLFPVFLSKLMAAESVRRGAVIALFIFGPTMWLDKWLDFRTN